VVLIFTDTDKRLAKKQIAGFRSSYLIDLNEYMLEVEYVRAQYVQNPTEYLANKEVEKRLKQSVDNKKTTQIVYFHFDINEIMIENVRRFYGALGVSMKMHLFDPSGKLCQIHHLFDRIVGIDG
jgi:hypothetical protein